MIKKYILVDMETTKYCITEERLEREIQEWNDFYNSYMKAETDAEKEKILTMQYKKQQEDENEPIFVFQYEGEMKINKFASSSLNYWNDNGVSFWVID